MADLILPKFKAPEGFKNIFKMSAQEMAEYFNLSEEQVNKLFDNIFMSMHENNIEIERDEKLKEVLSPDEWKTYSETGFFTWDGVTYNSDCEVVK